MTPPIPIALLLLLLWESAVCIVSLRLAALFRLSLDTISPARFGALVLGINIIVGSLAASAIAFLKINSLWSYLIAALVLLALGLHHNAAEISRAFARMLASVDAALRSLNRAAILAGLCLLLPLLFQAMHPISEIDSLTYAGRMLHWLDNEYTPHTFSNRYAAFWETGYLPAAALTRTDAFFWATSLKPVAIVYFLLFELAGGLGFAGALAHLISANALLLYHYALEVGTLKNDAVFAAGFLLLADGVLSLRRPEQMAARIVQLTLGMILVTVKFPGTIVIAILFVPLALIGRRVMKVYPWAPAAVFAAVVISTGHYYIKNLVKYGSPVYPFVVNIFGYRLPGVTDATGTEIIRHLGEKEMWKAFLSPGNAMVSGGLLFPAILILSIAGGIGVAVGGLWRLVAQRKGFTDLPLPCGVAIFVVVGWLLYARSYWSADSAPGVHDLFYLNQLGSLRFVEGTLALSELFVFFLLRSAGLPLFFLAALIAANAGTRLAFLYQKLPGETIVLLFALSLTTAGLLWAISQVRRLEVRRALLALLFPGLCALSILLLDKTTDSWLAPFWQPVLATLRRAEPSSVLVLTNFRAEAGHDRYLAAGGRFEHTVVKGTEADLLFFAPGDVPVAGDWTGDGKTKLGSFRQGRWRLDLNGNGAWDGPQVDREIANFGAAGDLPVVGDWNGDGKSKIGVFRDGVWRLDLNGNGIWDGPNTDREIPNFGTAGDLPVAGKWTESGGVRVGVFRRGTWYLDWNGNTRWDGPKEDREIANFGAAGDLPVIGDWNGRGVAKPGVFHNGAWRLADGHIPNFGAAGDVPLAGDWDGSRRVRIGVYRQGSAYLDINGNGTWDAPPASDRLVRNSGAPRDAGAAPRYIILIRDWDAANLDASPPWIAGADLSGYRVAARSSHALLWQTTPRP